MNIRHDPMMVKRNQDTFSNREVGVTHPDLPSYMKLSDNGDVEVFAKEGLGFILHKDNNSITFVADSVRFITNEREGLRWNKLCFNPRATQFSEPAFVPWDESNGESIYNGVEDFL